MLSIKKLKQISTFKLIRHPALWILKMISFDLSIANPWTNTSLYLNIYKHKGYWFYGKKREEKTMRKFVELIKPNDTIVEIGGHIGYITQLFSHLAGGSGNVIVFEPGINNQKYIKKILVS